MKIIVDVNVLISSLLGRGIPFNVFFLNDLLDKYEFIAPEFLLTEFEKHEQRLLNETKLSKEEFEELKNFLFERISFIPTSEFSEFLPKAGELLQKHTKDVPYLALSLKLNCKIFSGDKTFKKLSPDKVLSPREMLDILLGKEPA